jgi:enediyne biosynthesis protein E4
MKKKYIGILLVGIALALCIPAIIGYIVQGPGQPQGETDLRFAGMETDFVHETDLDKALPFMGIAAMDTDGDGVDEVFVGGGTSQEDVFLKFTEGALKSIPGSLGITKKSGDATFGAASIDATGDGLPDLFVARQSGLYFYKNVDGQFAGTVVDFPLDEKSVPLSIALGDINKDGAVDLYVSNYIRTEFVEGETIFNKPYGAYSNLLLNNGDNTFTDITKEAGLYHQHNTFVSVFVDLNNDSESDLVIAHDTGTVSIYRNNGDLTFTEMPNPTVYSYPMGIAVGDINGDGLPDLYFSNVGNTLPEMMLRGDLRDDQPLHTDYILLENQGDFVFTDTASSHNAATYGFGWGVVSFDFNNDTLNDYLFAQNYARFPGVNLLELYPGRLLQQYPDGQFKPVEGSAGMANENFGISPLVSDFNQDGWPDVVWANLNGPLKAFMNQGGERNWLKVRLPNAPSSIGAIVSVNLSDGTVLTDQFITSEGLCSDQTHELLFGLGEYDAVKVVAVRYQDGHEVTLDHPAINSTLSFEDR